MIKKRLIAELGDSKKYIAGNVAAQWVGMLSNAVMIFSLGSLLQKLVENKSAGVGVAVSAAVISLIVRAVCSFLQEKFSFLASKSVKKRLREMIFSKLLRLGSGYREKVSTSFRCLLRALTSLKLILVSIFRSFSMQCSHL